MAVQQYTSKKSGYKYWAGNDRLDESQRIENGLIIAAILMGYGWTANAVAGILGNMQYESTCNPGAYYGYSEYSATSFGLVQWDPTSKYQNWADSNGYAPYHDIEYQCERIHYEFENGIQYYSTDDYPISRSDFIHSTKDPYELGCAFAWNYERSATVLWGTAAEKNSLKKKRGGAAEIWYGLIGNDDLAKNLKIISDAIAEAVRIANDDSYGYDQNRRWGNPDYDCSSLIIHAYEHAGCPVKTNGASYTGNMRSAFKRSGFIETAYVSGMELKAGDVLWRTGHVEMYIGDDQKVGAHINELGKITGGQGGDQTGHEIDVSAMGGRWEYVLRLPAFALAPEVKPRFMKLALFAIASEHIWEI